jgi:hypothetical protein
MNYLDQLPDDIYKKIATYMYAEVLQEVESFLSVQHTIFPELATFQNGSDHIRSNSLCNSYRRHRRHFREADWYKLLIDLERPCACQLACVGFFPWLLRRWRVFDLSAGGDMWWTHCKHPTLMTYAGWRRVNGLL